MKQIEIMLQRRVQAIADRGYDAALESAQEERSVTESVTSKGKHYQIDVRFWVDDKNDKTVRIHGSLYESKESKWWKFFQVYSPSATYTEILSPDTNPSSNK